MSVISFLKLVEIQTKVASVIPFLLGTVYTLYRFDNFNLKNFALMLISLLAIDMLTTATNNYYDYKNAKKKHGFGYEKHNAIVNYNMKERTVLTVLFTLATIGIIFGILLYLNTSVVTLFVGAISFGVGVLYSFGPIPISRTPLGEIFSGLFMGFVITFVAVYIHIYDQNIVSLVLNSGVLSVYIDIMEVVYIFLVSLPAVFGISNIMLANNICDIEDDIENRRYTVPVYIGRERALTIFKVLYYLMYINLVVLIVIGVLPIISLITLITIVPVYKNIRVFYEKQTKKNTFVLSVKNFVLITVVQVLTIAIGILLKS